MLDLSQINTVEKTQPLCNYTHGKLVPECGITKCAHSENSCHYGGAAGTNGAEGVDFNVTSETYLREGQLYQAILLAQTKCRYKKAAIEQTTSDGVVHWHTHVTATTCDRF